MKEGFDIDLVKNESYVKAHRGAPSNMQYKRKQNIGQVWNMEE